MRQQSRLCPEPSVCADGSGQDHQKKLLVIPFWEFDRIDAILDDFFAGEDPAVAEPPESQKQYEPMRDRILERLAASAA